MSIASTITVTAEIRRFDPSQDAEPRYEKFEVSGLSNMSVLDVVRSIYEHQSPDLAYQFACRVGRCGTCAMRVNDRPVLACQERCKETMRIEPLTPFPVLRDLVVDRTEIEGRLAALELAPKRSGAHPRKPEPIDADLAAKLCNLDSCLLCMVCVSACPAVEERPFDGPAFMLKLRHMAKHPADHGEPPRAGARARHARMLQLRRVHAGLPGRPRCRVAARLRPVAAWSANDAPVFITHVRSAARAGFRRLMRPAFAQAARGERGGEKAAGHLALERFAARIAGRARRLQRRPSRRCTRSPTKQFEHRARAFARGPAVSRRGPASGYWRSPSRGGIRRSFQVPTAAQAGPRRFRSGPAGSGCSRRPQAQGISDTRDQCARGAHRRIRRPRDGLFFELGLRLEHRAHE
jgi:succinate dehydrogenase/fumarate reductase iron-sulfur protein